MKTVSNRIVHHCLARGLGDAVDGTLLLRQTGITLHELENPKGRIDAERHFRFLTLIQGLRTEIILPESTGLRDLFADYLSLACVCSNAVSLREALCLFLRYRPLVGECDQLEARMVDGGIRFTYHSESNDPKIQTHSAIYNFYHLLMLARHYTGHTARGQLLTLGVLLSNREMRHLQLLFGCPVRSATVDSFTLEDGALDTPYTQANPDIQPYFLAQAESELLALKPEPVFSLRIRHLLQQQMWRGQGAALEVDSLQSWVCEQLGMTRWTLARRLGREQLTFQVLCAEVRGGEARRLLRDGSVSMLDISHRLGFSSQSSFTRFFREQCHCTPRHYRRQWSVSR